MTSLHHLRQLHQQVTGQRNQHVDGAAFVHNVTEYTQALDDALPALLDIAEAAQQVNAEQDNLKTGLHWMYGETGYWATAARQALTNLTEALTRLKQP